MWMLDFLTSTPFDPQDEKRMWTLGDEQALEVHHITLNGAGRQTSIGFWAFPLACL